MIKGLGVSKGIGIGQVYIYSNNIQLPQEPPNDKGLELSRIQDAIVFCKVSLETLYEKTLHSLGQDKAQLFQAHIMLLEDPEFMAVIKSNIEDNMNGEQAVKAAGKHFETMFLNMDNAYFNERAADVRDVAERLIYKLMGQEKVSLEHVPANTIIVAEDLTPSDTAQLNGENTVGIVTEIGGDTSHSAIIARSLGIPAVMGLGERINDIKSQMTMILDGNEGHIILEPGDEAIKVYEAKKEAALLEAEALKKYLHKTFKYEDGRSIEIAGNIALPEEADNVLVNGGEGVGLFRSEFIYMNRETAPDETTQFQAYKKALTVMADKPITIRTMDIGGDKEVSYIKIDPELNPFLGYRAIRYCFDHEDFFKTQLRALYRASVFGRLRIMFPMVSRISEIRDIKAIIEGVKEELNDEGLAYSSDVELGIMIEVPSAAIMSDLLAEEVDFASIGTNDLTQYTMASDRMNPKVQDIYSNFDPAVIRLVKLTIDNFHKAGKWVGMCGSAAGNPKLVALWYAMGLDEFSMTPNNILEAKAVISSLDPKKSKNLLDKIMSASSKEAVIEILDV